MRKLLTTAFWLVLLSQPAFSTNSKWFTSEILLTGTGTTFYAPMGSGPDKNSTDNRVYGVMPATGGGTLKSLTVLVAADPGATKSYDFTVYVNTVATALTCNIASGASPLSCTVTASVAIANKNTVSVKIVGNGTPTNTRLTSIIEFQPATTNESVLMGNSNGNITAGTSYGAFSGNSVTNATESNMWIVSPTSGTVGTLCVKQVTGTGAGGSRDYYVSQNGAPTAITVNFANGDGATTKCDTTHTLSLAALDTLSLEIIDTSSPTATFAAWGVVILPTVSGDFIIPSMTEDTTSATQTQFYPIGIHYKGGGSVPTTSESSTYTIASSDFKLKAMCVYLSAAPNGATKSYSFYSRTNGNTAANNFYVPIVNSAVSGCNTGGSLQSAGDYLGTLETPANTPTVSRAAISYLATMNFTANTGGTANAVLIDYGALSVADGTQVTSTLLDSSTFGIYGTHGTAVGGGANLLFSTAAHHALGGTIPTQYFNPWPGESTSTVGLAVTMNDAATLKYAMYTYPAIVAPVTTAGVWFKTSAANSDTVNPDVFSINGTSNSYTNVVLNSNGQLRMRMETPGDGGSCTGNPANYQSISTNTWYWITIALTSVIGDPLQFSIYDSNLNLIFTDSRPACLSFPAGNMRAGFTNASTTTTGYTLYFDKVLSCGSQGETCTFPLLPTVTQSIPGRYGQLLMGISY